MRFCSARPAFGRSPSRPGWVGPTLPFDRERSPGRRATPGFDELPVRADVAARVADLPAHHRDPFDRLLVVQAMAEPVLLYTVDPLLPPYTELVRFVG